MGITIVEGELDLVGGPVTGRPIKGLAIFYYLVEASANLLDRRVRIPNVRVDNVDIVELETLKRGIQTIDDMFTV